MKAYTLWCEKWVCPVVQVDILRATPQLRTRVIFWTLRTMLFGVKPVSIVLRTPRPMRPSEMESSRPGKVIFRPVSWKLNLKRSWGKTAKQGWRKSLKTGSFSQILKTGLQYRPKTIPARSCLLLLQISPFSSKLAKYWTIWWTSVEIWCFFTH